MASRRTARWFAASLLLLAAACSGGGGGCGALACLPPIPAPYSGAKSFNAAVTRISPRGFETLNRNWKSLVTTVMPGAHLDGAGDVVVPIDVPCTPLGQIDPVGNVWACDNGQAGPGSPGFMDGRCDGLDAPCPVSLTLESLQLYPVDPAQTPNAVAAYANLRLDALDRPPWSIYLDSDDAPFYACAYLDRIGCYVNFHSAGRGSRPDENLWTTFVFGLDTRWGSLLTIDVPGGVGGIEAIEPVDFEINGSDGNGEDLCDWICSVANWGPVKDKLINDMLKPKLAEAVRSAVAGERCRSCAQGRSTCPAGSACGCLGGGSCEDAEKVCLDQGVPGACVPGNLGLESRLTPSELFQKVGLAPRDQVDLYVVAGGSVTVRSDVQAAMIGGAAAVKRSPCVPDLPPPPFPRSVPLPDLEVEAPHSGGEETDDVGIAVAQSFLNYAFYQAHRAGDLCLNVTGAILTTDALKAVLPSMGVVAGSPDQPAPLMAAMRPLAAPVVKVGAGTIDPATGKLVDPLVKLFLKDLAIDFYAFMEDRWVRLFGVVADIQLPLSLSFDGCPEKMTVVIGELKEAIAEIRTFDSEILAEKVGPLVKLVPAAVAIAEQALGKALEPLALPIVSGFRLEVDQNRGLKGINRDPVSGEYSHLAVYGGLGTGPCPSAERRGGRPAARLVETRMPSAEAMASPGPVPWPSAVIQLGEGGAGGPEREHAFRVDDGLWSTWRRGPRLVVEHPMLTLAGRHRIEIRSRTTGAPKSLEPGTEVVEVAIDRSGSP